MTVCNDVELCLFGDAPTLAVLNTTYGPMTAAMWLVPQLYNLSEYCGCKNKLESKALEECAIIIATNYYYLKVTELMLFFHRFKLGVYGRFYGAVDPLVITISLRSFVVDRNNEIIKKEEEEHQAQIDEDRRGCVTFLEWCKMTGKPENYNPLSPTNQVVQNKDKDISEMQRMASFIEENSKLAQEVRELMNQTFERKYGLSPKDVLGKKT